MNLYNTINRSDNIKKQPIPIAIATPIIPEMYYILFNIPYSIYVAEEFQVENLIKGCHIWLMIVIAFIV